MASDVQCVDCGQRKGIHPGIVRDGKIGRLCQLCFNKWRPFMHHEPPEQACPHCVWCADFIRSFDLEPAQVQTNV